MAFNSALIYKSHTYDKCMYACVCVYVYYVWMHAAKIIETHSPVFSDNYGFRMSIWKP